MKRDASSSFVVRWPVAMLFGAFFVVGACSDDPAPNEPKPMEQDSGRDAGVDDSTDAEADGVSRPVEDAETDMTGDLRVGPDADTDVARDQGLDASGGVNPDTNGDGTVQVLVLGTNRSIDGRGAFSPDQIATELGSILAGMDADALAVNVVAEDIHQSQSVVVGLGQAGTEYPYTHHSHSLAQYYHWPDDQEARWSRLSGSGDVAWDHVVIAADPFLVATLPGYHALGSHKVAAKVAAGGAQPLLLMVWPQDASSDGLLEQMEETTRRVARGAPVPVDVVPAGSAWRALDAGQRDEAGPHPTPRGATLAAAAIFSQIVQASATVSSYPVDDALARAAWEAVQAEAQAAPSGQALPVTPFHGCDIQDDVIRYNHTGTSSERGILRGLQWVFDQAPETLQNGGEFPIHFNYGRANSNFEANKRYQVDSSRFDFSFGFPMQDHGNYGDESMRYGLDHRESGTLNDTDVGVARFMVEQAEMPQARAVPIRTLFAEMREAMPDQSAYSDAWHMHRDLDRASGAFMYTLLTGKCVVGAEPADRSSEEWRSWVAHKIGYETAWTLMHLEAAPACVP